MRKKYKQRLKDLESDMLDIRKFQSSVCDGVDLMSLKRDIGRANKTIVDLKKENKQLRLMLEMKDIDDVLEGDEQDITIGEH